MIKLYRANIGEYTNDEYTDLLGTLPPATADLLSRKALLDDRKRSLLGHLLILGAAKELCGVREAKVAYTPAGKPYFPDLPLGFSVSHSADRVILAVSDREIGADIEKIRPVDFRIAARFFTPAEKQYVSDDVTRFFEVWTKKEALAKQRGGALSTVFPEDVTTLSFYTECDGEYFLSVYEPPL